jgi:hypothetical protein
VAERLGHEKIQTTLDTYAHLYPNQNREIAEKLNQLMDDSDDEETNTKDGECDAKAS